MKPQASDQELTHRTTMKHHWETMAPTKDHLKDILDPLTSQFIYEVHHAIELGDLDTSLEALSQVGDVYIQPYGRIGMLPPALFGDISKDAIWQNESLVVPTEKKEMETLADGYVDWGNRTIQAGDYKMWGFPNKEELVTMMERVVGMEYPADQWRDASKQIQDSMNTSRVFLLDLYRMHRVTNGYFDHDELNPFDAQYYRQHEAFAVAFSTEIPREQRISFFRDVTQIPIGEYGTEAAEKLARVNISLNDYLKQSDTIEIGARFRLDEADKSVLAEHTARTRERYQIEMGEYAVHGVINTLGEGVLSVAQVIAFLTSAKVEGYDTYDELVAAILDTDLIEQFTRIIRPGRIAPITLSGLYLPEPLAVKNGKLSLDPEVVGFLSMERKQFIKTTMAQWAMHKENPEKTNPPFALGLTCPAAAPKGSITILKNAFKEFYPSAIA